MPSPPIQRAAIALWVALAVLCAVRAVFAFVPAGLSWRRNGLFLGM